MQRDDRPATEETSDTPAEPPERRGVEVPGEGRLDSTFIDVSRTGPPPSEGEYIDESGD